MAEVQQPTPSMPRPDPEPPSTRSMIDKELPKSRGEKLFDWGVYGGLGFFANAAISLTAERYARHVPTSKIYKWGQTSEKMFADGFSYVMRDAEKIAYWSGKCNQILFLGMGGWIMPVPIKWLEDHKPNLVGLIDESLGTGPQTSAEKAAQRETFDNGPRQSYISQYVGRFFSYTATIAVALPFVTKWTRTSEHLTMALEKTVGRGIGGWYEPTIILKGSKDIPDREVSAFLNSTAVEAITAGTAAILHYGSSKAAAVVGHQAQNAPTLPGSGPDNPAHTVSEPSVPDRIKPLTPPVKAAG